MPFQKGHGYIGGGVPKGTHVSIKTEFKKGNIPWNKGLKGVTNPPSRKGKKPWNKGIKLHPLTYKTKKKISKKNSGSHHWNWKNGKEQRNKNIRKSLEYREWRRIVFERDNYVCQICKKRGGMLHAHHIKEFSKSPELILDLENGITVCVKCHYKIHRKTTGY